MTGARDANDIVWGWRRANGRLGIRNRVVVLPADQASCGICATIAARAPGAIALPGAHALAEGSRDPAFLLRISVGLGSNPNVAAAVVVGADRASMEPIAERIASAGTPTAGHVIGDPEDRAAIERAAASARDFMRQASALSRERAPLSDLWIAAKCEQSDATTGLAACPAIGAMYDRLVPCGIHGVFGETPELMAAAEIVARRAANEVAADKWAKACVAREAELEAAQRLGTEHRQPTDVNIAGGLTTVREKALASLQKIGRSCRFIDVLQAAEPPAGGPGLYYMDTSSETESIGQMAAAGFVLTVLATGEATAFADPIVPILQINGNPPDGPDDGRHIDLDVTGILSRTITLDRSRRRPHWHDPPHLRRHAHRRRKDGRHKACGH